MTGLLIALALAATATSAGPGEQDAAARLLFRENWSETPAALPMTQAHVSNPDLVLSCHGPGAGQLKKSHHEQPADDPYYVWSGEADGTWAVSLRHRRQWMDLRGPAKVRWRARQSGFRRLHLLVRLADDTWIVSEESDGESGSWRVHEFALSELHWRQFDVQRGTEGRAVVPDLSGVVEVGFTDLMHGGGTPASSRLDWIEVYGSPIPAR